MIKSLQEKTRKWLPRIADATFVLWLFTEAGMEHSLLSRVCMALFALTTLLWMCVERRAFFSQWMAFYAAFTLWAFIGVNAFALDRGVAMETFQTVVINAAFLFVLYQYLLLRKNVDRVLTYYMYTVLALVVFTVIVSWPIDLVNENAPRLGELAGVNPNTMGMLSAFAFALALYKLLFRSDWYVLLVAAFIAAILLTKSSKAYLMAFCFFLAIVLLRYPKKWGWKLAALFIGGWVAFRFVIIEMQWFDMIFFHRLRYIYENLFMGADHLNSLTVRQGLLGIGLDAAAKRPFTGYGLDCFRLLPANSDGLYSHNNYIELLISGGVPLLLLYYAPLAVAIYRGFARKARQNRTVQLLLLFTCVQLLMDTAVVSYADRTLLMIPILLMAATRLVTASDEDGARAWKLMKNPYKLVQWGSTRGMFKSMDDARYLPLLYRGCTGKKLRLAPPVTFNEKQQWMKLYDRDARYPVIADKLAVRDYVAAHAGEKWLVPLLGCWTSADDVDFTTLPQQFVLKCTHDSGSAYVCGDKAALDEADARSFLAAHLQKNYYTAGREWPYKDLTPRVIAEAFIGSPDGTPPDDYKFYCFDGKLRAILNCTNRTRHSVDYAYFGRDWNLYPVNHETVSAIAAGKTYARPAHLTEMIALAETLAAGYRFLRVDLYEANDRVYFGELTLFDNSGFATDLTDEGDALFGTFLRIDGETEAT